MTKLHTPAQTHDLGDVESDLGGDRPRALVRLRDRQRADADRTPEMDEPPKRCVDVDDDLATLQECGPHVNRAQAVGGYPGDRRSLQRGEVGRSSLVRLFVRSALVA